MQYFNEIPWQTVRTDLFTMKRKHFWGFSINFRRINFFQSFWNFLNTEKVEKIDLECSKASFNFLIPYDTFHEQWVQPKKTGWSKSQYAVSAIHWQIHRGGGFPPSKKEKTMSQNSISPRFLGVRARKVINLKNFRNPQLVLWIRQWCDKFWIFLRIVFSKFWVSLEREERDWWVSSER